MNGQDGLAYGPAPGVTWVKDAGQTILVDGPAGRSWTLEGVEAAAWDLLVLGYTFERAAGSLALLAGIDDEQGRRALLAMIGRWRLAGILCAAEEMRP
jgi:hypothetical protein